MRIATDEPAAASDRERAATLARALAEAAGAAALFSNMDLVNLTPGNPDDVMSVASSEAMKAVLEYRLKHTIPAFPVLNTMSES